MHSIDSLIFFFILPNIGTWICDNCLSERNGKRRRISSSVPASLLLSTPDLKSKGKGASKRKGGGFGKDESDEEAVYVQPKSYFY